MTICQLSYVLCSVYFSYCPEDGKCEFPKAWPYSLNSQNVGTPFCPPVFDKAEAL